MLYDGVFRFLAEAKVAFAAKDRARYGERISRTHAILEMLLTSLDDRHDRVLAERLTGVYIFCMDRVLEANIKNDPSQLDRVLEILEPLRDAWRVAAKTHGAVTPLGDSR
jgi:flagellar protein FliS